MTNEDIQKCIDILKDDGPEPDRFYFFCKRCNEIHIFNEKTDDLCKIRLIEEIKSDL